MTAAHWGSGVILITDTDCEIVTIAVISVLEVDRLSALTSLDTEFGTGVTRIAIRPDQLSQILPRNNHNMVLVEMSKGNRAFKTDKPETCPKHSKNVSHSEKLLLSRKNVN